MKIKHKLLVYNFLGFAILFILFRLGLSMVLTFDSLYISLISAIGASFLAPKFAALKKDGNDVIVLKWIFIKGFKEL